MISDLLVVVGIAAGSSLALALLGLLLLRVRRRSMVLSLTVVALVSVGAVLAGAIGTAAAMFLSDHDLQVLLVVVTVAGSVGVATAVVLGRAVVAGSRALGVAAAGIGDGGYTPAGGPLSAELAHLDRQLAETSSRLEASRERERALESSRRELVAWVSHDLRTPLAGIRAMAEALEDGVVDDDPETVRRCHTGLRREADRLAGMVDGDSAYVEVADACGGIPDGDLPRVFEVAFRGTAARTPGNDGGAGLGRAIARGLVEAHHGEISISNHGPGCRVLVRLPAARLPLTTS